MSKYKGLFTYDIDNHRYIPVEQADGIISDMNYTEEPKYFYCISTDGSINKYEVERYAHDSWCKNGAKIIGNYFETREEAEKAVKRLKAWERLKDKGFRFTGIAGISNNIYVSFETDSKYSGGHVMYDEYSNTDNKLKEYNEDLTLLFGGEE